MINECVQGGIADTLTYEVRLVGDAAAFDRIRVGSNGSDLNIL